MPQFVKKQPITPNLRTSPEQFSREDKNKRQSAGYVGDLEKHLQDRSLDELAWESEQLAKSHGIYLEFNRDKSGKEKDWMYMIRFSIPGGGPLTREQWRVFDECSERYARNADGQPSLRLTTRQNIQLHWIKKPDIAEVIRRIAATGVFSLNGCGDNARNVMACPLSAFSTLYDANALAQQCGEYFRLPAEPHIQIFGIDPHHLRTPGEHFQYGPQLLNRKFKIAFSAVHYAEAYGAWLPDNCVELRTNDVGVAPIVHAGKVERFQVYLGGGQGERAGKPTFTALGLPLGIVEQQELMKCLDAIVRVHQEWGDRQNRHWARLKYVVRAKGIDWYRDQVRTLTGDVFSPPDEQLDIGPRHLHHGWVKQPSNGLWAYGAFIENGRIINGPNGNLKSMVHHLMENYPVRLMTTPNQDLLFTDVPADARESFEADLGRFGHGTNRGRPYSPLRRLAVACVGLPTCRLSYTDSERYLPQLIDELEDRGWGDLTESIGMSGCERQCSRPATKTIAWVGSGKDRYQLKLLGTEDAQCQGEALVDTEGRIYLKQVPREAVADVTGALFEVYRSNRRDGELMGYFFRRVGLPVLIESLKQHDKTAALMEK